MRTLVALVAMLAWMIVMPDYTPDWSARMAIATLLGVLVGACVGSGLQEEGSRRTPTGRDADG